MNSDPSKNGGWQHPFCGCCTYVGPCLLIFCCGWIGLACTQCISTKKLTDQADREKAAMGCLATWCCCCLGAAWNRQRFRKEARLNEDYWFDCAAYSAGCLCCMGIQEWAVTHQEVRVGGHATTGTAGAQGPQARVIFVIGGPGAGKGTQCKKLKATGKFGHISSGDELRDFVQGDSEEGRKVKAMMDRGELVPSSVPVSLVRKAMQKEGWTNKVYLIDGFPRNTENLKVWDEMMSDVKIEFLLYVQCDNDEMVRRLLSRGEQRADDNPETIKKRVEKFDKDTSEAIAAFRRRGRVIQISGMGEVDGIFANIRASDPIFT